MKSYHTNNESTKVKGDNSLVEDGFILFIFACCIVMGMSVYHYGHIHKPAKPTFIVHVEREGEIAEFATSDARACEKAMKSPEFVSCRRLLQRGNEYLEMEYRDNAKVQESGVFGSQ